MDGAVSGPSLVKQLASCDQTLRERSLRLLLKTWLPVQTSIPDSDLKKLWKGLFYCVWHADKVQFQSQLINRLSAMMLSLELPLSVQYFSVFLLTMRREWNGIDALRLDKFYLLIRRFLHSLFALMKKYGWDSELVGRLMAVLEERTFGDVDQVRGSGVDYHIATVFLEELRPFTPLKLEMLEVLLKPLVHVMKSSTDKVLLGKIRSNVFDVLLANGKKLLEAKRCGADVDSCDDVMVYGTLALKMGFASKFFELGSSTDCVQGNRKLLFGLHEEFLKLEKKMESSGIEVPPPEPEDRVDDEEEEEVPILVPINGVDPSEDGANGAAVKTMKKRKKSKKELGGGKNEKKRKTKKKKKEVMPENGLVDKENSDPVQLSCEDPTEEPKDTAAVVVLDESMMSNLQMQFEKVAAEEGLNEGLESACDFLEAGSNGVTLKKRKRGKSTKGQQPQGLKMEDQGDDEGLLSAMSGEKSVKKVRFSMKNNLVWKPHTPLPPQSIRIPPSVTPRGSALKKGLSPGPIKESPPSSKKAKQRARTVRKIRKKTAKGASPAVKRLKKLKASSP
ncbi:ribosomal RNA processing protein 1 homolog [Punica granatum]|nr:ribosomal RNA processing protein 1 homolog [Punica granatum]OWM86939.1 hypothetical protein CDL15_Pgr015975 [Punica granatum]